MAAFVSSIIATILMVAACLYVGNRRPIGTPVTWGEAMVAGTWVFGIMMLAYGIVPHQWLNYADNELLWRPDKLLVGISSGGVVWGNDAKDLGGTGRRSQAAPPIRRQQAWKPGGLVDSRRRRLY